MSEVEHYSMSREMRHAELRVIQAAHEDHAHGCAPEACGGSRLDPCKLANALETLERHHGSREHLLADLDQALAEYTPYCQQCDTATHLCPGCGTDVPHGTVACPACSDKPPATEEPHWVLRTWADVVTGDEVRMPGTDATATISMRYRHPSEDPTGQSWHVRAGHGGHWNDSVAQPGECVVRFGDEEELRTMLPTAPVEIKLTANEVEVLELMGRDGWAIRVKQEGR